MSFLLEHPGYFPLFLEFAAHAARDERLMRRFAEPLAGLQQAFAAMIGEGARGRGVPLSDAIAAKLGVVLTALAHGLALARLADPERVPDELFGDFVSVFFDAMTDRIQARDGR